MKKNSQLFSLIPKDFLNGLFVAVTSAVFGYVIMSLEKGNFSLDWNALGILALSTALGYINKRFISNDKGDILKK